MLVKWCFIVSVIIIQFSVIVFSSYRVTLRSIDVCTSPDPPFDGISKLQIIGYNKSVNFYFRGNVTIGADLRLFYKMKTGVQKSDGVIHYTSEFKKLTCKSMVPKVILMSAGVRFNEKTCQVYKGNYTFNRVDLNKLQAGAYYNPIKEVGENIVYFGAYSSRGTTVCTLARYVMKAI